MKQSEAYKATDMLQNFKEIFYPTLLDFRQTFTFWKVPRLRPFVLPVRATFR